MFRVPHRGTIHLYYSTTRKSVGGVLWNLVFYWKIEQLNSGAEPNMALDILKAKYNRQPRSGIAFREYKTEKKYLLVEGKRRSHF